MSSGDSGDYIIYNTLEVATGGDYGGDYVFDHPSFPRHRFSYVFVKGKPSAPHTWARAFAVLATTERCGGGNLQKLNYGSLGEPLRSWPQQKGAVAGILKNLTMDPSESFCGPGHNREVRWRESSKT